MSKYIKADFTGRLTLGGGHVIPVAAGKVCEVPPGVHDEAIAQPGVVPCTKDGKEIKPAKEEQKQK